METGADESIRGQGPPPLPHPPDPGAGNLHSTAALEQLPPGVAGKRLEMGEDGVPGGPGVVHGGPGVGKSDRIHRDLVAGASGSPGVAEDDGRLLGLGEANAASPGLGVDQVRRALPSPQSTDRRSSKFVVRIPRRALRSAAPSSSTVAGNRNPKSTPKPAAQLSSAQNEDYLQDYYSGGGVTPNNEEARRKIQFKVQKVIAKCEQARLEKALRAKAKYERKLQKIENEARSNMKFAIAEAMLAPEVAIVCHGKMLEHQPPNAGHNECPARLTSIMNMLKTSKILDRCKVIKGSPATFNDLLLVHSEKHAKFVETLSSTLLPGIESSFLKLDEDKDEDEDMYYSLGTSEAIMFAVGSVMQACDLVLAGPFQYSFAFIRPPGHHSGVSKFSGFCYVNNICIAAKHCLKNHRKERLMLLDFDIHHGDGSQEIFYKDKNVLFVSVHRFEAGFFPLSDKNKEGTGSSEYIGAEEGKGYNVNVCWKHGSISDVDYAAVWEYIVLPLVKQFDPEVILVSAGFDAAHKDLLGDCKVTPNGFGYLIQKLMSYPIVMALEGGYELSALAECATAVVKVLLGEKCPTLNNRIKPYDTTWDTIKETRKQHEAYWSCFKDEIPESITSKSKHRPQVAVSSGGPGQH